MATSDATTFVFVNKTASPFKIQQQYQVLSCVSSQAGLPDIQDESHTVLPSKECAIVAKNVPADDRYERVVIVHRVTIDIVPQVVNQVTSFAKQGIQGFKKLVTGESSTTKSEKTKAIFSLVGRPDNEKLCVYPIPYPPYTAISNESTFFFHLVHSATIGSQEALTVLLAESVSHPFLLEAHKQVVAAVPKTVDNIKNLIDFRDRGRSETIPVRIRPASGSLCQQEDTARQQRFAVVRKNLKIPDEATKPPVIATATSGGGMRAMVASVGFLAALKEIGVLDITTYAGCLSGSTWSTSKWMNAPQNPFVTYKDQPVLDCWSSDVAPEAVDNLDVSNLLSTVSSKIKFADMMLILKTAIQHGSIILAYAKLLEVKMAVDTGDYKKALVVDKSTTGKFPIPVYTASFKDNGGTLQWADFTPFEIGSTYLTTYFNLNEFQLYAAPTPPLLSQLMGVWGSAFYCTIVELIEEITDKPLPQWMRDLLGTASLLNGAQVINANYNRVDSTGKLLPMANQQYIFYRDGGILANLPITPMLRPERNVDLLIALDSSSDVEERPFQELIKCLPSIASKIPANPTYPYKFEATADYPQIIYIPLLKNNDYDPNFDPKSCSTFNFQYDEKTTMSLQGLAYYWTKLAKDMIMGSIASKTTQ